VVETIDSLNAILGDAGDLLEMAAEEGDEDTVSALEEDLAGAEKRLQELEFRRMFAGEMDP
jgi:peptide chain release factor 2